MHVSPLDFSQARTAPEWVSRELEEMDPTACVVHMGGARWAVGKIRPNRAARKEAEAMFATWTQAIQKGAQLSAQGKARVRFAQLALLGFRVVTQLDLTNDMQWRTVVDDFRESRYRWLHAPEDGALKEIDALEERRREDARRGVEDPNRAKEAWKYAFTRSHSLAVSNTPKDVVKSGWKRVSIPAA